MEILSQLYPSNVQVNRKWEEYKKPVEVEVEATYEISNEKAKGLGVSFIPLEVSLRDSVESFKEKGFLSI
ncbi:bifunctional dihydroflavonol 4-reductase/flavanone 4-reductase [Corchorus olitorius]|uniref:Bifunctional dihydroflavonol 4-reductase/flavanone 4-reductase n=1 Tax=Corchorus olitorius TaxID=93759 RepID=A0A1R3K147_9ROSI|nr:bifunctional dihydroflavonol 4-reductase/flavanone 4-reductase [Corchorus olitorius]